MNFKFSTAVGPNINDNDSTGRIMRDLTIALLFIVVCSVILQFNLYGAWASLRVVLICLVSVATCIGVDFVYFKAVGLEKAKSMKKMHENVPYITGLILALTLPLGSQDSMMILFVAFISSIIAELFGKLFYGGFGYNIFNPAAVGRAFALISFGAIMIVPQIDGMAGATPLNAIQDYLSVKGGVQNLGNFTQLLMGTHGGMIGETLALPIIIAMVFLIARRVIDWVIPVATIVAVVILSTIHMFVMGYDYSYLLLQVFGGGILFGGVFMLTDPVTNPISRQGKIIYAIIFATLTFAIRSYANLAEGVLIALLFCNMFVPLIDRLTSNITDINTGKKFGSVALVSVVCYVICLLLYFVNMADFA